MYMFGLIILLFIHIVFWSGLYIVIDIAKRYGIFCVLDNWLSYLLITLAILSFLFPFVLYGYNQIKRKTINVFFVTFLVTLTFCVISGGSLVLFDTYYSYFTPKKWEDRPSVRNRMIDDLKESHNLMELNKEQVVLLLGEPDERMENDTLFYYYYDCYGKIAIFFKDNKVESVELYSHV